MPVVVYRQPWFWAVIVGLAAVLIFAVVIGASGPGRRDQDTTTIVQQPSPAPAPAPVVPVPSPQAIPVPSPGISTSRPAAPSQPVAPARPAQPKQPAPARTAKAPAPQVIHEKTVIIREKASDHSSGDPGRASSRTADPADAGTSGSGTGSRSRVRNGSSGTGDTGSDNGITPDPSATGTASRGAAKGDSTRGFENTSLPKRLQFEGLGWQATGMTTIVGGDDNLKSIGAADDGTSLYVNMNAQEPYQSVMAPVPDQDGHYVIYRRK